MILNLSKELLLKSIFIGFLLINSFTFAQNREYVKKYYQSGVLKSEGWIENSNKSRYWKYYFSNGKIAKEGSYKNGVQDKYWYYYNTDGSKLKEGHFNLNKKEKWWILYENNAIICKSEYKKNKLNGFSIYYKNEKIVKIKKFLNDVMVGEWTELERFKTENNY